MPCISPWMIRISAIVLGGWAYTGWACCPKGSKGYNLKIKNPVSHGVRDSLKKKNHTFKRRCSIKIRGLDLVWTNNPTKRNIRNSFGKHVLFSNGRVAKELHSINFHPILGGWFMTLSILPTSTDPANGRGLEDWCPLKNWHFAGSMSIYKRV